MGRDVPAEPFGRQLRCVELLNMQGNKNWTSQQLAQKNRWVARIDQHGWVVGGGSVRPIRTRQMSRPHAAQHICFYFVFISFHFFFFFFICFYGRYFTAAAASHFFVCLFLQLGGFFFPFFKKFVSSVTCRYGDAAASLHSIRCTVSSLCDKHDDDNLHTTHGVVSISGIFDMPAREPPLG